MQITNTSTLATVDVRSPLPYGFAVGGAFSPDGSSVALFVKTNSGDLNPTAQLALADPKTGRLRLVPGAPVDVGEPVGWARWSDDHHLVGGGVSSTRTGVLEDNHYLVDTRALAVKSFSFLQSQGQDINYSSVLFPLSSGAR